MSIQPLAFTGVSKLSTDFQSIIDRALAISNLPVKALQNRQKDIAQQKVLAGSLNAAVGALATSVSALGTLGTDKAVVASSSDLTKVIATAASGASPGYYAITDVTSIARAASETSVLGYATGDATAVSTTSSLSLTVGATSYPITLGAGKNNLAGLRDAINALGAGVTASVLTTGTGPTPYYLSVSANASGATTLTLKDDPTPGANINMLTSANQGADTVFKFAGLPVTRSSTQINDLAPGLTLTVLATTGVGQTVGVTLASDRSKVAAALTDLAAKYNAALTQVNAQTGSAAGLLSGNSVVRQSRQAMQGLVSYSGSGSIKSLTDLGIELSKTGQMSFKPAALDALTDTQLAAAFTFFGSTLTGLGALQSSFTQISDPVTGLIQAQQTQFDAADKRLTDEIAQLTDRIAVSQASLRSKLQKADSLLALLESQQSLLTSNVQSLNYTTFGKQTG